MLRYYLNESFVYISSLCQIVPPAYSPSKRNTIFFFLLEIFFYFRESKINAKTITNNFLLIRIINENKKKLFCLYYIECEFNRFLFHCRTGTLMLGKTFFYLYF